ncbi:MAG: ABC transporter ATP-binding protein [Tannerellaceae bacterium]|jgi:ABC-type lipoprotein export system ATPase subunit|nr:ABC transporter ATP-binding protein [Tannerellaceae bacterium]
MIQVKDLEKSFPDGKNHRKHLLRGICLEAEKGAFIAIMGASGSGKTTLLSILGTLMEPDSGTYFLNGQDMTLRPPDRRIRNRAIGFLFQEPRLMPQLNVRDNILLPTLAYQNRTYTAQEAYARQLMELSGIASLTRRYPHTLSGGEAGRVALCRALVMKPPVLLADEPTGQLDADNARQTVALLSRVNRELDTTILLVTHSAETASAAQKRLTLQNGLLK